MVNARGKTIDNTHLSVDQAEKRGFLHREYIIHCLRWTHVAKYLNEAQRYKSAQVLDIGCGVDLPLAKMLYTSRMAIPQYVGVDYNNPEKFDIAPFHTGKMPVYAIGNVDFAKHVIMNDDRDSYSISSNGKQISPTFKLPTVITCFEVLEHVEPGHARAMLKKMLSIAKASLAAGNDPRVFISTPCHSAQVGAADNHVSEITHDALGGLLEDLGFAIEKRWGTFARQRDYKHNFVEDYESGQEIWDKLSEYYDSNYIATILAPLYPTRANNCLWRLMPATDKYVRRYPKLVDVPGPWTHSSRWADLNSDEAYNG